MSYCKTVVVGGNPPTFCLFQNTKLIRPSIFPEGNINGSKQINRGEIYWIQPNTIDKSELGSHPHPYVVVQDDVFNHSRIHTVVVCALTTNIGRASLPGNILLDVNEGNLPKQSVVEVSKVSSVDKKALGEKIGQLSEKRVSEILAGLRFLQTSSFTR